MFSNIANKTKVITELFSLRREELILKKILKKQREQIKSDRKIYVETLQSPFSIVSLAIFLPVLSKFHNAELVGYRFVQPRWYSSFSHRVLHKYSLLAAMGIRRVELIECGNNPKDKYHDAFKAISSKRDLLDFEYMGIRIGDLIYDTYLNEAHNPTVFLNDERLLQIFADACGTVEKWIQIAKQGDLRAVCVGHTVYKNGIPARVCIAYDIPAYQVTLQSIYSLRKELPIAHFDFLNYPRLFAELSDEKKTSSLAYASTRLNQRIKRGISPELSYLPVSAYKPITGNEQNVIRKSDQFKVLIATHDFYDSPHCNGDTLYEDFYTWLIAIAELSKKTNFDWYIKNHPYLRGDGERVVSEILDTYPHIELVPSTTSHQQLFKEGINAVLTVYGTIASEYAAMGLKAVNACKTNPHCAYSFSFNPTSIEEFENIVISLDTITINIKEEELHEYFYMHYLHFGQSWAFDDEQFESIASEVNNPKKLNIYSYYTQRHREGQLDELSRNLRKCIEANNYRLDSLIDRR